MSPEPPADAPPPVGTPAERRRAAPGAGRRGRGRPAAGAVALALLAVCVLASSACWRIGEPTPDDADVAWAAYPDTVVAGETFSFEFGGAVSPNTCARLDTATVDLEDGEVVVGARRSVFDTMCPDDRVSFYRAGALSLPEPGHYPVRSATGRDLGAITALDSGEFSVMKAVGWGTLRQGDGGCVFFGPGWATNQRPFDMVGLPDRALETVDTDRVIWTRGRIRGWSMCGAFGSRSRVVVDSIRVTEHLAESYYYPRP